MKKLVLSLSLLAVVAAAGPLAGKRVASFTLPDSAGKYYDVLDYRGKVLIIDVMKTDCPHCQSVSKLLERVKARYGDKVNILSIVNPPDNPKTVSSYIARYKVTSPILFDVGQATAAMLKITAQNPGIDLPTVLIVDAQGIIREDLVYTEANHAAFDGDALFPLIDRALLPKK
jgi:peroxiredoxin